MTDDGGSTGGELALDRLCAAAPEDIERVEIVESILRMRVRQAGAWGASYEQRHYRVTLAAPTGGQSGRDCRDTSAKTLEGAVEQMLDGLKERPGGGG